MEKYKQEIKNLTKELNPRTPPEVWEKKEQESIVHI
jgi:hypothetical protein